MTWIGEFAGAVAADAANWLRNLIPAGLVLRSAQWETRAEKRQRQWRAAVFEAIDLVELGFAAQAMRRAKKALHLQPNHPQSHAVMGLAHQEQRHHEAALNFFNRAYDLAASSAGSTQVCGLPLAAIADLAALAAHSCATLHRESLNDTERRAWADHVKDWFEVALQADPFYADVILRDTSLAPELRISLQRQLDALANLDWAVQP
ncbi:MAG: hypothetical protein ACYC2H_00045 [Thermoplasmatota archaeon]